MFVQNIRLYEQINLHDGRLYGLEALIRWRDSAGNAIPPDIFIPIAEETGQIRDIDHWVFNEACRSTGSRSAALLSHPVVSLVAEVLLVSRRNGLENQDSPG